MPQVPILCGVEGTEGGPSVRVKCLALRTGPLRQLVEIHAQSRRLMERNLGRAAEEAESHPRNGHWDDGLQLRLHKPRER